MTGRSRSVSWLALTGVFALALVSCSSGTSDEITTTTSVQTPEPTALVRQKDGILRIGLLIPQSDPTALFGAELARIAEEVVGIMNNFGGFGETEVELVIRDEGTNAESATMSAERFILTDNVDAVVGPFSALNAPTVVPMLVSSEVAVCSPTVSTSVMNFLEDDDLFIRTSTLDSEVIGSMIELAVQSGRERVSVAYPDDPYGRNLLEELKSALASRDVEIVTQVGYSTDGLNFESEVSRLTSDSASVELLIGDPVSGPLFLKALVPVANGGIIITNDGLANATVTFDPDSAPEFRPLIFGTAPDTRLGSDTLLSIFDFSTSEYLANLQELPSFTMNTVDCLTLIWLAANTTSSDEAREFKKQFIEIAKDGSSCRWLFDCSFLFDRTLNLDYDGVSSLTLDDQGNAIGRGTVYFQFNADGKAVIVDGEPNFGFIDTDPFAPPA